MSARVVTSWCALDTPSFVRSTTISAFNVVSRSIRFTQSSLLRRSMTVTPRCSRNPSPLPKSWLDLRSTSIQEYINRNLDDADVPIDRKNIISLPGGTILKIGPEHCRIDYAWLKFIESCNLPDWVCVPKLRSSLVEFDWEDSHLYAFAMEKIYLPTLEEVFKTRPISDELADRIIEGLCSLRTAVATVKTSNVVPDLDRCLLQGHMFPSNKNDCWYVSSQEEVKQILDEQAADGNNSFGTWEWAWGDCSPGNIYVSPEDDKTIYYADFGYAMNLPCGYDLWTLTTSHYSPYFTAPLIRAFARRRISISPINLEAFTKVRDRYRRI